MAVISSIIAAATAISSAVSGAVAFASPYIAMATPYMNALSFTGDVMGLIGMGKGDSLENFDPTLLSPTYSFGPYQTQSSNELCRPIIYGKVKCAGNVIWQNANSGSTLQRIVSFADGEIKGFSNIKLNDIAIGSLQGCSAPPYTGNGTQTIPSMVPGTTQQDKAKVVGGLKYDAYLAITATASEKINGAFIVTAEVEGSKVRVYTNPTTYTTEYSTNPAWCILDFLTRYNGCGVSYDEIDVHSFLDASEYCNEPVNYKLSGTVSNTANSKTVTGAYTKFKSELKVGNKITIGLETQTITVITSDTSLTVGSPFAEAHSGVNAFETQPRFTLNIILDIKKPRLDWLGDMLACCRGYLTYQGGKISLKIEQVEDTTLQVFTPDNIIAGSEKFWTSSREERYDIVKLQFIDPDNEYVKVFAQAEAPVFKNEQPLVQEIAAYGVINFRQASSLAWYYLNQANTCNKYISFKTTKEGLGRTVGDVIGVTSTFLGYVNKKMRIVNMAEAQEGQIEIVCKEYNGSSANAKLTTKLLGTNNNLLYTSIEQTTDANKISIQYTYPGIPGQSLSVTVTGFDINISLATDGTSQIITTATQIKDAVNSNPNANILVTVTNAPGNDGSGLVAAMPKKYLSGGTPGIYSDQLGSDAPVFDVVNIDDVYAPPEDVQVFATSQNNNMIQFSWQKVPGADDITYEIREGDSWNNSSVVATVLTGNNYTTSDIRLGMHQFWICAKSPKGFYSNNAKLSVLAITDIIGTNLILSEDLLDADLLSGIFTNCYACNNRIILNSNTTWQSNGTWDNSGQYYETGDNWGSSTVNLGIYESPVYDIGADLMSSVNINYNFYKSDESASILIEWKYSEDNITWSDYKEFLQGSKPEDTSKLFRYYMFKITMTSSNTICSLDKFIVYVDVPDRDLYFTDQVITNAISGITINFTPAYTIIPSVVANISDGTIGYTVISAKSTTQATVKAYNNSGIEITASVDIRAKGY